MGAYNASRFRSQKELGKVICGLSFAIGGAFHIFTSPRKIPADTSPSAELLEYGAKRLA